MGSQMLTGSSQSCSEKLEIEPEMLIGGVKVNYFFHCKSQLWFFSHFITQEQESDLVLLGKFLEEFVFKEIKTKEVIIDQKISIDFIKKKDMLELHDIKKSSKFEKAHYYQMLYYIWYLKKIKGIENVKGIIDYVNEKKKVEVFLTEEKEKEIEEIINEINRITSSPQPPQPVYNKYCRKCSYFEFCWVKK